MWTHHRDARISRSICKCVCVCVFGHYCFIGELFEQSGRRRSGVPRRTLRSSLHAGRNAIVCGWYGEYWGARIVQRLHVYSYLYAVVVLCSRPNRVFVSDCVYRSKTFE